MTAADVDVVAEAMYAALKQWELDEGEVEAGFYHDGEVSIHRGYVDLKILAAAAIAALRARAALEGGDRPSRPAPEEQEGT